MSCGCYAYRNGEKSRGVDAEIKHAVELGKPVKFISFPSLEGTEFNSIPPSPALQSVEDSFSDAVKSAVARREITFHTFCVHCSRRTVEITSVTCGECRALDDGEQVEIATPDVAHSDRNRTQRIRSDRQGHGRQASRSRSTVSFASHSLTLFAMQALAVNPLVIDAA
jgi:hypothetical protein